MRWWIWLFFVASSSDAMAQNLCQFVAGAIVIASDGKYLGRISNQYDADSIMNEYGNHGSQYSASSIWNQYGTYGGQYSDKSPFNQYTSTPPVLVKNDRAIARLTTNRSLSATINPFALKACEFY